MPPSDVQPSRADLPGPRAQALLAREHRRPSQNYRHDHPLVVERGEEVSELAARLGGHLPWPGEWPVCFASSRAEGVETATKLARLRTVAPPDEIAALGFEPEILDSVATELT